jgi:hypothetical protein
MFKQVFNGPFTYRNIAKDTDIKGYESIEVHGVRNNLILDTTASDACTHLYTLR